MICLLAPTGLGPLERITDEFAVAVPQILLFFGVLVGGLILASLARKLTAWLVKRSGLEALGERFGVAKMLYAVGFKAGLSHALGSVAWVTLLLFTVAACAEVAGLDVVASGIGIMMSFLPRLLAAAAVLVGGVSLATALRGVLRRLGRARKDVDEPDVVATVAYYLVVTIAGVMAADQAGLETELVGTLVTVGVAVAAASAGFSFAMASRPALANLVASHYLRRCIKPGDQLIARSCQGVVASMTASHVVVQTETGVVHLPNQLVMASEFEVQGAGRRR